MSDAALVVMRVAGPALVVDAGRPGRRSEGVPPGGAMIPELLVRANRAAGNPWGAAALEVFGAIDLAARGRLVVSIDVERHELADGETLHVPGPAGVRVRYVAVAGGLEVPDVLGGRGTLLVAGLGGHEGRLLRAGDVLPVGASTGGPAMLPELETGPLRVLRGPDLDRTGNPAFMELLAGSFRVSPRSDRIGTRLEGSQLPRSGGDAGISLPMVRGAVQLPASGEPVVLGPDHPTTGGYPVIAVVIAADHGRLGALRPGDAAQFTEVSLEDARKISRAHDERWFR